MRFHEEGREWRLPGLWYGDDLVLCDEWEEDLKVFLRFVGGEVRNFMQQSDGVTWERGIRV